MNKSEEDMIREKEEQTYILYKAVKDAVQEFCATNFQDIMQTVVREMSKDLTVDINISNFSRKGKEDEQV